MPRGKGPANGKGVKPKQSQNSENNPNLKPLSGRLFYLDITSCSVTDKLEKDIRALGGTVEGFLSKEISILITSKKEAKCKKSMKYSCLSSPEPAPNPGSNQGGPQEGGGSKKKLEQVDVSRGRSLLEKAMKEQAMKEQESVPRNCVLACAWNWGVRVLHVDDAKVYLEAKKKLVSQHTRGAEKRVQPAKSKLRKPKPQKLETPFIKVEDYFEQYKPFYLVPPSFQSFRIPKTNQANKASGTRQGLNNTCHGQDVNDLNGKTAEPKKQGYCECCHQKFNVLEDHLASPLHQNFSRSGLYHEVDSLIAMFEFDFVDWSKQRQPRSSNSIVLPTRPIDWRGVTADSCRQNSPKIAYVKPTIDVRRIDLSSPDRNMQSPDPWAYPFHHGGQGASSNGYHPSLSFPVGTPIFPTTLLTPLPPSLTPLPPSPPRTGISRNFSGETRTASVIGVRSPVSSLQEANLEPFVDAPLINSSPAPLTSSSPAPLINSSPAPLNSPPAPLTSSSPESEDVSPTKRMKLSGSRVPVSLFSEHVDAGQATSPESVIDTLHRDMEPAFLSIHDQSDQSSPFKLQRKVKLPPPRRGKPEEPSTSTALRAEPSTSSWRVEPSTYSAWKMSVPAENCEWQSPRERLLSLFETSEAVSDFFGFSSRSEILPPMDDDEEPSTRDNEEPHTADDNGEEPPTRDNGEEPPNTDYGEEPLACRGDFQWLAPSDSSDTFHGF